MLAAKYLGKGGGYSLGPGGQCVCPACGTVITHQTGIQCYLVSCPKCGRKMTRMIGTFQGLSAATMPPPPSPEILPETASDETNIQTLTPAPENAKKTNGGNGKKEENGKMPTWAWVAIAAVAMFLLMER